VPKGKIKVYYIPDEREYTLVDLAKVKDIKLNRVRHLYEKYKRPEKMTYEMLYDDTKRGGSNAFDLEVIDDLEGEEKNLGIMSFQAVVDICNGILSSRRPYISYNIRWCRAGKPPIVRLSMFMKWKYEYRGTTEIQDDDLPHIVRGDLEHLSNRERCPTYNAKPGTWEAGLLDDDEDDIYSKYPSCGRVISR
jgi:hypothetical protein